MYFQFAVFVGETGRVERRNAEFLEQRPQFDAEFAIQEKPLAAFMTFSVFSVSSVLKGLCLPDAALSSPLKWV